MIAAIYQGFDLLLKHRNLLLAVDAEAHSDRHNALNVHDRLEECITNHILALINSVGLFEMVEPSEMHRRAHEILDRCRAEGVGQFRAARPIVRPEHLDSVKSGQLFEIGD